MNTLKLCRMTFVLLVFAAAQPTDIYAEEASAKAQEVGLEYEETNFNFDSKLTGISYPIKLYVPNNYDKTEKLYPVVYATDGQWHGGGLVNKLKKKGIEVIWVAIEQGPKNRRAIDYVVPGSQVYYQFLTQELIPTLEPQLRIDATKRTLMGTSLGGLFVNTAMLLEHPEKRFFSTYLSFDAAMYRNNQAINFLLNDRYSKSDSLPITLILTTATRQGNKKQVKKFQKQLEKKGFKGLKVIRHDIPVTHKEITWPSFDKVIPEAFLDNP